MRRAQVVLKAKFTGVAIPFRGRLYGEYWNANDRHEPVDADDLTCRGIGPLAAVRKDDGRVGWLKVGAVEQARRINPPGSSSLRLTLAPKPRAIYTFGVQARERWGLV
jgi:hypothetical protein